MATTITGNTIDVNTAVLNRLSTDGTIVDLRKDGTAVGSIGVDSGDNLYITGGSGGTGGFYIDDTQILPATSGPTLVDNTLNLGRAATRFKDLYLSGGVHLGGTGAANKLQDYETGTWTSSFDNSSITDGSYVKIGRMVYISGKASCTGAGGSGTTISGLPFAPASVTGQQGCGIVGYHNINTTEVYSILVSQGSSTFTFRLASTAVEISAGANFRFNLSYPTDL